MENVHCTVMEGNSEIRALSYRVNLGNVLVCGFSRAENKHVHLSTNSSKLMGRIRFKLCNLMVTMHDV